jgi:hypothetical protein
LLAYWEEGAERRFIHQITDLNVSPFADGHWPHSSPPVRSRSCFLSNLPSAPSDSVKSYRFGTLPLRPNLQA